MADLFQSHSRSARLDQVLQDLLGRAPELQAASVVSFDGLPMASALPSGMDEDRVAAMSAALLSLGERAAENFGRGALSQVYVEGENGTVFLVSADDEAVLVAVGAKGAKVGLLMFEVRRSAQSVADALRADDAAAAAEAATLPEPVEVYEPEPVVLEAVPTPMAVVEELPMRPEPEPAPSVPTLHVVEGVLDDPAELDPETDEPYLSPYEPTEPYATPYAEELPPPAPTPWGTPLTAVSQPETPRPDSNWQAYDQSDRDPGGWA
jgi:predicted regulator of Ras-like GTPase activity (Roadblock/LC7/MglB family)